MPEAVQKIEQTAHSVASAAHVVEEVVEVAREEDLDWATVREAAALAGMAALRFVQWWLCGRGLHSWQAWEYEDGTLLDECEACGAQRESA